MRRRQDVPNPPDWLIAVRGSARYAPDSERPYLATVAGTGFGAAEGGLRYLTLDASEVVSTTARSANAYGGPQLALSVPLARGRAISYGKRPRTTVYIGASGGGLLGDRDPFSASLDLGMLYGLSPDESVSLFWASLGSGFRRD